MSTNLESRRIGFEFLTIVVVSSNRNFPILYSDVGTNFDELFSEAVAAINNAEDTWPEMESYRDEVRRRGEFTDASARSIVVNPYSLIVPVGPMLQVHPGTLASYRVSQSGAAVPMMDPVQELVPRYSVQPSTPVAASQLAPQRRRGQPPPAANRPRSRRIAAAGTADVSEAETRRINNLYLRTEAESLARANQMQEKTPTTPVVDTTMKE